jgi:quinol monooxygenase YgiN
VALLPVVRLFGFRPTRPAFDNVIREWIVPTIRAQPGVVDAYVGRHGPDELGPRLVASVWESRTAMESAFGGTDRIGGVQPEGLDGMTDGSVEVLSPDIVYRVAGAAEAPRIIRILRGCAQPGQRERYVEEARAGVFADVAAGHGPSAFYLARGASPEAFVAVSVWSDWRAIELATGGDIRQPMATRRPELIESFDATHFEAIDL